jgi:hypothetical protein
MQQMESVRVTRMMIYLRGARVANDGCHPKVGFYFRLNNYSIFRISDPTISILMYIKLI